MAGEVIDERGATPLVVPPRVSSQDRLLKMLQERYPGYHPVLAMAEMAHRDKTELDPVVELACHKEIAKYVVQVDRFVEVKGEIKQTRRVVVELFGASDQREPPTVLQDVSDVIARESVREEVVAAVTDLRDPREALLGAWGVDVTESTARFA